MFQAQRVRFERFHLSDRALDQRDPGQRDRDRVLYTNAFRRLAAVTQVTSPNDLDLVHTRLTHTLEVAQVARRLAEHILRSRGASAEITVRHGLDIEVAEAAALAHDLGHPPFGHIAESELDSLAQQSGLQFGFEGNAQSFRIVTRLETRFPAHPGLNLTRATLNAILKYPRLPRDQHDGAKYGAYDSETEEFEWARSGTRLGIGQRTLEAEIMDWADDVAYAVHDMEDFFRAGLIPLNLLLHDEREVEQFLDYAFSQKRVLTRFSIVDLTRVFTDWLSIYAWSYAFEAYEGSREQRANLRSLTATLIGRYLSAFKVDAGLPTGSGARREPELEMEVAILKELTWFYVIENPSLAVLQRGQRQVIRDLFRIFLSSAKGSDREQHVFPLFFRESLEVADSDDERIRVVIDFISSMTEAQAIEYQHRLTGVRLGPSLRSVMV